MSESKPKPRNIFDQVAAWLSPPDEEGTTRRGRGRLAQIFAVLGTTFALLQLLFSTLDLANRAVSSVLTWLPYVVPALFIVGIGAALYFLLTAKDRVPRRRAGGALGVMVLVVGGWGGWSLYHASQPSKAIIILVADFNGRNVREYVDWGRHIYEPVKWQTEQLGLGERVEVRRVFQSFTSAEQARKQGQASKATLVLWGQYDDRSVSPRFELLRVAEEFQRSLVAQPQSLSDFEVYFQALPQEMAYITSVVLGLVQYADGTYPAAETMLTAALASAPADTTLLGQEISLFFRANTRFLGYERPVRPMGDIVADLEAATALRPSFWQAHWNLALAYADYCEPELALDQALKEAQKVVDLQPGRSDAFYLMGQIHAQRDEWQEAESAYRQALRLDPEHADALEALGKALEETGQDDAARLAREQAVVLRQQEIAGSGSQRAAEDEAADPAEHEDTLGYAYLNAGRYDEAIATFREAIGLQPNNPTFHRHLGNAYYFQGKSDAEIPSAQLDRAISAYERAQELDPDDSLLLTQLGGAYVEAGEPERALAPYQSAVQVSPCDDEAWLQLANLYATLGRTEDADETYARLVQLNPRWSIGWQWLATRASLAGDDTSAVEMYRKALDTGIDDADLLFGLASSLYRLGDYEGAEAAYGQAHALAPDDETSLAGWGDALLRLGRVDEAVAAYEKAVALEPDSRVSTILAGLYMESGRSEDALAAYTTAADAAPENAMAQYGKGSILLQLGQIEEGATALELAVASDTESLGAWQSLALAYVALNRLEDAETAVAQSLRLDPQSILAHVAQAGVAEARGDLEQTRDAYRKILELPGLSVDLRTAAEQALARLDE